MATNVFPQGHALPPAVGLRQRVQAATADSGIPFRFLLGWSVLHVFVALAMKYVPGVATLHGLLVILACVAVGASGKTQHVLSMAAYVAGCEVMWRSGDAAIPWESGKYLIILVLGLSILRRAKPPAALPFLYLAAIMVSMPLSFGAAAGLNHARKLILFNISGPLALFVVLWFVSGKRGWNIDRWKIFAIVLGPILGTAAVASFKLARATNVQFKMASSSFAAGGYGANQVASIMSLGILLLFIALVASRRAGLMRWLLAGLMFYLIAQTALTMSRSGLAMALGGAVILSLHYIRSRRNRTFLVLSAVVVLLLFNAVLLPFLQGFTGGVFLERFTDTELSNRDLIMRTDIKMFLETPLLGVGPGVGAMRRLQMLGVPYASHTEFTRMLAEHGILGLVGLAAMIIALYRLYRQIPDIDSRGIAGALLTWALLFLSVNGFRLATPAFAVLLAACFLPQTEAPQRPARRRSAAPSMPGRLVVGRHPGTALRRPG